jgi:hypothetical protein
MQMIVALAAFRRSEGRWAWPILLSSPRRDAV